MIQMYHLVSTNPNDYGTIKFRSSIGSMNSVVLYRVASLSTIASFSMTTPDDYLVIETTMNDEAVELILRFQEHGAYELRTLTHELNNLFEGQLVPVDESLPIEFLISMDSTNRLVISANKEFVIKEASHRARLILGLYHDFLPMVSTNKQVHPSSVPYICYGNVLYLTSKTDFIATLNLDNKEINRSICYKINELLYPGVPISCKLPGSFSLIHSDSLASLEFQLVDFMLQPVVLHSPLYITIEIQRLDAKTNETNLLAYIDDI